MFRLVYTILFSLCMPFVFLKLLWRGYRAPEYKARKLERFGFFKAPKLKNSIWVHAVSVGEVLAAEPIVREIQQRYPDRDIVITSMTPTSSEQIRKRFGDSVFHVYAPYDVPLMVKAFLRRIQPDCLIIMETELWPNIIHQMMKRDCPVVIANARLSERSARGYQRLKPAIGWMLNELSLVLCQHENDARRFASLEISQDKIYVTGSVKFDVDLGSGHRDRAELIKKDLDVNRPVWIAASTHEGEDEIMLSVHQAVREHFADALMILVPRHPERFDSAFSLSEDRGFIVGRRTLNEQIPSAADVFIVDTMGELMDFYAVSDIAVIGGSFVEVGGHNPIEPSALGLPVLIGPHFFNFEAICQRLQEAEGLDIVEEANRLSDSLVQLMKDSDLAKEKGLKAQQVVDQSKGAVNSVVNYLQPLLESKA